MSARLIKSCDSSSRPSKASIPHFLPQNSRHLSSEILGVRWRVRDKATIIAVSCVRCVTSTSVAINNNEGNENWKQRTRNVTRLALEGSPSRPISPSLGFLLSSLPRNR